MFHYDGGDLGSTDRIVQSLALGKAETVRIGATRLKKQNKVNAKTSTKGEVTFNARNVKIAGVKARAALTV